MRREFKRIAIVNRGEPAMRLIRAVRELNAGNGDALETIALFTEPDRRSILHRWPESVGDAKSVSAFQPDLIVGSRSSSRIDKVRE